MTRYLFLLLSLLSLTGCTGYLFWQQPRVTNRIDSAEVSRIILTYSEKLRYEKGLQLEDSVIYYEHKINRVRLDFSSMDALDMWGARALLVDVVEEMLVRLNENYRIYNQMRDTPFTPHNLEVYIRFKSFFNKHVDLQTIGLITLRQGIANYFASDALDCESDCWHRRSEWYWQSRDFITFKRQGEALYGPQYADSIIDAGIFSEDRYYTVEPETKDNGPPPVETPYVEENKTPPPPPAKNGKRPRKDIFRGKPKENGNGNGNGNGNAANPNGKVSGVYYGNRRR